MRALRLLVGSVLVYLAVACANAATPMLEQMAVDAGFLDALDDAPSSPRDATSSGSSGAGADGMAGILDALTDPVSEAQADPSASGSRLKLQYYVGSDSSKAFAQILDTMTSLPCSYQTAADGMTRCLPTGQASVNPAFFSDSACSKVAAQGYAGCAAPTYAVGSTASACVTSPTSHVYLVGAVSSVFEKVGTTCTAVTGLSASFTFYSLGAEVPASSFVAGSLQSF
jgi:hypothetical protein